MARQETLAPYVILQPYGKLLAIFLGVKTNVAVQTIFIYLMRETSQFELDNTKVKVWRPFLTQARPTKAHPQKPDKLNPEL